MLTSRGQVKVLDFGLAKLTAKSTSDDDATNVKTTPGLVMGTLYYMSPEQALGRPLDHRSDLFSAGVVLYELVTGKLPFVGTSTMETLNKITNAQPDPIARFNYATPPELERMIRKLLEKDPARRYQSARDLYVDLKNLSRDAESGESATPTVVSARPPDQTKLTKRFLVLVAAGMIAAVALLVAGAALLRRPADREQAPASIDSVAVLPFANTSKDPETEYLSDGISESIMNNLAAISSLRVTPRSTVFRYKGKDSDLRQVAKDLDVRALVAGRVLRRGDTLSVQAELIDTHTNAQIWGERYEGKLIDALALQKKISSEIANRLRTGDGAGSPGQGRVSMTMDGDAYQFYLKGRYHWNKRTVESIQKALGYFQEAAATDPGFALAHVGLADSYLLLDEYADQRAKGFSGKAEEAVQKAISLDPGIAEAYATLGLIHQTRWEWEPSEEAFRKAIELNPDYPTARHWYNLTLRCVGRGEEALEQIRKGQQLDPLSMIIGVSVVETLMVLDRDREALETAEKYMEMDPAFPPLLQVMSHLYSDLGRHAEAIAVARKGVELSGDFAEQLAALVRAYAMAGDTSQARETLRNLELKTARGQGDSYNLALAYAALGDTNRTFAALERSFQARSSPLRGLKDDVRFKALRSDPRFNSLLGRMGLKP